MNFSMQRFLKQIAWLAGLVLGCQSAFGFALIGPPGAGSPDSFEVPAIGYALNLLAPGGAGLTGGEVVAFTPLGDIGTPKSYNEGYRRNTPVLYYAFDESFLRFFGTEGAAEVDKAMAVYNNLAPVSEYSADLSEFPTETRRQNFRASADSLLDVKSMTMGMLTEQLGFFQPTRWVWGLKARLVGPGGCPANVAYSIIKRNYDIMLSSGPDAYPSSSYVNGVLYSYFIFEGCTGVPVADAIEFPVDPLADPYSAVADYDSFWYRGLTLGTFYTGLTRDDMGGLRYLINSNNIANEPSGARTIEFETNAQPAILTNQDLHAFSLAAATNDPATLIGLYPGLVINSVSSSFWPPLITTNITEILTNSPYDFAGAAPTHPLFSTNYTTNIITYYHYTFANVVTNAFSSRGLVGTISLGLTNSPYAPAGTPPTVITTTRMTYVNGSFGGFFLLPTNLCAVQILSNILTQVIYTTNLPVGGAVTTNLPVGAGGGVGGTNPAVVFTPGSISVFTNRTLVYLPITCPVDTVAERAGVEKITFVRRDYDWLLSQTWDPITNDYTLEERVNGVMSPRRMQRFVPRPDFLFTAADLAAGTTFTYSNTVATTNFSGTTTATEALTVTIGGIGEFDSMRTEVYNQTARPGNQAGPGIIEGPLVLPTLFVFNETGPLYLNQTLSLLTTNVFFLGEAEQTPFFDLSWGSFDGTTNAPTVYPNGSSITNLENLLTGPFMTTTTLPSATVGASYSAQLSATAGQPPYTWSLSPGSAGLPAGLTLTSDGQITGTPTGPGGGTIYDFSIRLTDSAGALKDQAFTMTVF